jgi:hypothetical protein
VLFWESPQWFFFFLFCGLCRMMHVVQTFNDLHNIYVAATDDGSHMRVVGFLSSGITFKQMKKLN